MIRLLLKILPRDVGCKTVANMIKGKTPEEIRKLFNIVNDFTPEEEVCLSLNLGKGLSHPLDRLKSRRRTLVFTMSNLWALTHVFTGMGRR